MGKKAIRDEMAVGASRNDQVRYWFERAVHLAPEHREPMLASACQDADVRMEVMALLECDVDGDEPALPFSETISNVVGSALDKRDRPAPVRRVGPFELGRLLGSGGMGSVYEAHRADGEVRQRVAVKLVQVSPLSSERFRESVHRRFARERQMLASLQHPYIAGLLDAGTTEDGTPYAVIEQVDGVPIDAYCDSRLPDPADRIRLLLKLCEAVQFAHRTLIVHSDIKPENVLVTADGIPKLIDFGVASHLSDDSNLTTTRAFTPGYASPELCRGSKATVATDVYGLGAVLYRLLTGAKPREVDGEPLGKMIRTICDEEVIRPSAIKPELRGDAENILLKALQREPQRRYGSVPEFADDLKRLLRKRPVQATPDSVWYRFGRFTQRHWVPLLTAIAFVTALAAFAFVSQQQRNMALRRAGETRRLAQRLLFEVHDEIGGVLGGTKARERLGAIAVQFLEGLERDYGRDPELAWELLNAYARLGQSLGGAVSSVGDTASALQFANRALAMGAVVENSAPDNARLDELFGAYHGLLQVFEEGGRPEQRREIVDRLLRIARDLPPVRQAHAEAELARYLDGQGRRKEAGAAYEKALGILRPLSDDPARPAGTDERLASALVAYGRSLALAGNFPKAVAVLTEAIRRSESMVASEPNRSRNARQLYWSHVALGDVFGSPGRFNMGLPAQAAEHYRSARLIAEKMVVADGANEAAKLDLARTYLREGAAWSATRPAHALTLLERARSLALQTSPGNHLGLDTRLAYLTTSIAPLLQLGQLERARHHLDDAQQLLLEMQKAGVDAEERTVLRAETMWLYAAGRRKEALAELARHLGMLRRTTSPVLSESFERIDLLERMRRHAAGFDYEACAASASRIVETWETLHAADPQSAFITANRERARLLREEECRAPIQ